MTRSPAIRFACLLAVSLQLTACSRGSDEEQIRGVIDAAEAAAEARDTSDFLKLIADHYRDSEGNDKARLQQFLRGYFITHPKIELLVRIQEIRIETAENARVRIEFALVGTRVEGDASNALTGETESLLIDLKRIDSDWRVVRVARDRP